MSAFLESGCYDYFKTNSSRSGTLSAKMKNYTISIMTKMRPPLRHEAMNLSKSISTVFIIFCGLLLSSIWVHMVSVIYFCRIEVMNTAHKVTKVCLSVVGCSYNWSRKNCRCLRNCGMNLAVIVKSAILRYAMKVIDY